MGRCQRKVDLLLIADSYVGLFLWQTTAFITVAEQTSVILVKKCHVRELFKAVSPQSRAARRTKKIRNKQR